MRQNQPCADLWEEHSRQREELLQKLYGGKCLNVFEAQNRSQWGGSRVRGM